jgi:hypothetical protein
LTSSVSLEVQMVRYWRFSMILGWGDALDY